MRFPGLAPRIRRTRAAGVAEAATAVAEDLERSGKVLFGTTRLELTAEVRAVGGPWMRVTLTAVDVTAFHAIAVRRDP